MSEWQGITIRDLLERVDLLNFINPDEVSQNKEKKAAGPEQPADSTSAFLGPRLWDKSISLPLMGEEEEGEDEEQGEYDVMSMDDFLMENNIRMDSSPEDPDDPGTLEMVISRPNVILPPQGLKKEAPGPVGATEAVGAARAVTKVEAVGATKSNVLPKGGNDFLYTESKRARLERERAERKRRLEEEIDFDPEDLALATVPGYTFDPKERAFCMEELRPQPIIKKRSRSFIPDEKKDETYWDRRMKNNVAARRSREARRLKENQIALRAAFLEKENRILKRSLEDADFQTTKVTTELNILKKKLAIYEKGSGF